MGSLVFYTARYQYQQSDLSITMISPNGKGLMALHLLITVLPYVVVASKLQRTISFSSSAVNQQCFSCDNARSNADCQKMVTCQRNEKACQTEIRVYSIGNTFAVRIKKGCKQEHACNNNFLQNDRPGWPSTQCNDIPNTPLSVCRYCCNTPNCNGDLQERQCTELKAPEHGTVTCSFNTQYNTTVCDFRCDQCYNVVGSDSRICLESKLWSGAETECEYDTRCDRCDATMLTPPENGETTCTDGRTVGSVCSIQCADGYDLIGQAEITCEVTKQWSHPKPVCTKKITCPKLLSPPHGTYSCTPDDISVNSVCSIQCDLCYRTESDNLLPQNDDEANRVCQDDGTWSNEPTQCIYDPMFDVNCPDSYCNDDMTTQPSFGSVDCTDGARWHSNCSFECSEGYTLQGEQVVTCMNDNSNWNNEKPYCKQDCHELAIESSDGNSCVCRRGYTGHGYTCTDVNECNDNSLNQCHEFATCTNTAGSYLCNCIAGYEGNGFSCVDIDECLTGEADCYMDDGKVCVNTPGSYECSCAAEYTGDGINCTKVELPCPPHELLDGEYCFRYLVVDPEHPSFTASDACANIESGHPATIRTMMDYQTLNAILLDKLVPDGDMTTKILGPWIGLDDRYMAGVYRWRDGSLLSPTDYQVWAEGPPRMRPVGGRPEPRCVHLVSDPENYGTRDFKWTELLCSELARYVCDTEKTNEQVNLCQPALAGMPNGKISCSDGWQQGSTCEFECNEGYELMGPSSSVTCLGPYMLWSNILPQCVESVCSPVISAPNSGSVSCTNGNKVSSRCAFSCDNGYSIHGSPEIECRQNLTWSDSKACCVDSCPPKARMDLIFIMDSSGSIGEENFKTMKQFVKNVYERFTLSDEFTRIAVVTFHSVVQLANDTEWFYSKSELDNAIDSLQFAGKGTLTGQALTFTREHLIGKREGSTNVVIAVTDGNSKDNSKAAAAELRNMNVHVMAVGITGSHLRDLSMIASKPASENVLSLSQVEDINDVIDVVGRRVCNFQC